MVESRITKFIDKHHVMTLATQSSNGVHCCNLFYAYLAQSNEFVFSSSSDTRHAQEFISGSRVAASIVLESKIVGNLQGLQIEGDVVVAGEEHKAEYIKKYPYAAVVSDMELWVLKPSHYKLTDNRLGFGKKLIWSVQ